MPVVKMDGSLEVPFDPRRRIKSDINRVTKANAATMGWSTRAAVVVREMMFSNFWAFKALATVLSMVYPRCGLEHWAAVLLLMPMTLACIPERQ